MSWTRRQFIRRASGLVVASSGIVTRPAWAIAMERTLAAAALPDLTTLALTYQRSSDAGYQLMSEGPGWPTVVREDLGALAVVGREDTREALAAIVHLTDVHVVDTQSPARVEFLDRDADPPQQSVPFDSAWRPQETLSAHIAEAMIRRINAIGAGPITGRPYDIAVSTGDNTDNQHEIELEWFMTLLDGGTLTPNTGDLTRYEGVQDTEATYYDEHYWHPDEIVHPVSGEPDLYKRRNGYPSYPGLLEAAIAPFVAEGISVPWYSTYGNHDGLLQGNAPSNAALEGIATGGVKVIARPGGTSADFLQGLQNQDPTVLAAFASAPGRPVTADAKRHVLTPSEYVARHLASVTSPNGHGYTQDDADAGRLYYTFDITDEILGISLDTVNHGGYADGSLEPVQLAWLEAQLIAAHSRYLDAGRTGFTTTSNTDRLVVLFSHHNSDTMTNQVPDTNQPNQERILGADFLKFLHRFPNVILWVNGHSHVNRVWPRPATDEQTSGFWEVNTAAHIDAPQHSRIVEIADNHDGTLSIFGTLIDHAGPAAAPAGSTDVLSLAGIARELAFNDWQKDYVGALGADTDRNVELIVFRPFQRERATVAPTPAPSESGTTGGSGNTPNTGGGSGAGLGAVAAAAAIASAAAIRRRGHLTG